MQTSQTPYPTSVIDPERTLALAKQDGLWPLFALREKLVKIGAMVVRLGRYFIFQMAEATVPHDMFREILRLVDRLRRALLPP